MSGIERVLRSIEGLCSSSPRRRMVAVAGPPGSGKSTFAEALARLVNERTARVAAVVPQDGFHLDNAVLDRMGLRAKKGSPETFDVDGLRHLLERLSRARDDVPVPGFDRGLDRVEAAGRLVPAAADTVIVEGNYLLLETPPWAGLRDVFDLTITLACSTETLRSRLTERWLRHGLTPEAAAARAEGNDLVNARLVAALSRPADIRVAAE